MSFKTLDNVDVYDKTDVDQLVDPISQDLTDVKSRTSALESGKADKSEIEAQVTQTVDNIIETKVTQIADSFSNNINSAVSSAVESELDNYATKSELNDKIDAPAVSSMIGDALSAFTPSGSSVDTLAVSGLITDRLSDYSDTAAVSSMIAGAITGKTDVPTVSSMIAGALASYNPSQGPSIEAMTALEIQNVVDQHF